MSAGGAPYQHSRRPRVFTIDPHKPFLTDLADGLTAAFGDDPLALSDALIYVPTRRAVRALREAFVARAFDDKGKSAGSAATLLPRIKALGDVDEDEMAVFDGVNLDAALDLPPAASAMERKLALAQLLAAKEQSLSGEARWPAALAAAGELSRLLDSFYTEEIDFSVLETLAPEEFAVHWGQSLKFLEIVTQAWPAYCAASGKLDPSERRAKLISAEAELWASNPPEHPVIVAGSTGSAPSVARLMAAAANAPNGACILPGLDRALTRERGWAAIDDSHPQAGLKALLQTLGLDAQQIPHWPSGASERPSQENDGQESSDQTGAGPRSALLSLALRPADATDDWRRLVAEAQTTDPQLAAATDGLKLAEARDEDEEALMIAAMMREAIETPDKTAMLVTPDRDLSRRVAAKLLRWRVRVDDSAGVPFHNSPCGTFLRLVAEWLIAPADPALMIAMARHPLAGFGLSPQDKSRAVNAADEALRGLAPRAAAGEMGADALAGVIARLDDERRNQQRLKQHAAPLFDVLRTAEAAWRDARNAPLSEKIAAHINAAEMIAASPLLAATNPDEPDDSPLWRGDDGALGAGLIAELRASAPEIDLPQTDYPALFTGLIAGASVRPRGGAHPRLAIYGPLEARLQSTDRVILAGLNEGVWPGDAPSDPFLSRPMRAAAGLPSPERRIGLAAHDFAQLAAKREVFLTRAKRSGGAPTKPSRWLLRLKNLADGANAQIDDTPRWAALCAALDKAGAPAPASPPNFTPPAKARLTSLYVTRIGDLIRDPYAVYARHILRLNPLDALGEPFASRHLGSLFHDVFDIFARAPMEEDAHAARARLDAIFTEQSPLYGYDAIADAFWRPAATAALDWFIGFHRGRMKQGRAAVLEGEGALTLVLSEGRAFTLRARADRIDLTHDGRAMIFDYKSKTMPSLKQISADFSPQLPLTALIAEQGGFEALGRAPIGGFYYLRVLGREGPDAKNQIGAEDAAALEAAREAQIGLIALLEHYADENTPFLSQPRPEFQSSWGDYDHLARRREWSESADGDET